MKTQTESKTQNMSSATIGAIVAVIVLAVLALTIFLAERPTLPAVTGEPAIDTIEPSEATADSTVGEETAPAAIVTQSGQNVFPEDTDDETTVTGVDESN